MTPESDALVVFGVTGDLAYKKIFPALQSLVQRRQLKVPIVGVGRTPITREQLVERVRNSVAERGPIDEQAFSKLVPLLQYVSGDYDDIETVHAKSGRRLAMRGIRFSISRFLRAHFRSPSSTCRGPAAPPEGGSSWKNLSAAISSRRGR